MSYSRTNWVSGETPLSADNMNNIEDGIEEVQTTANAIFKGPTTGQRATISTTAGASFTATKTGWLVATGSTNTSATVAPYMALQDGGGYPIAQSYGIASSGISLTVAGPVLEGQTYKVYCARCSLNSVRIFY